MGRGAETLGLCALMLGLLGGCDGDSETVATKKGSGSGGSKGAGANGSGANGSGANGSGANGSGANGSGANGSGANGSGANGSGANGSGANGSGANGSGANGSGANGAGANGAGSNAGAGNLPQGASCTVPARKAGSAAPRKAAFSTCTFSGDLGNGLGSGAHPLVVGEAGGKTALFALAQGAPGGAVQKYDVASGAACIITADKTFTLPASATSCADLRTDSLGGVWCAGSAGLAQIWPTTTPLCPLEENGDDSLAIDATARIITTYLVRTQWSYDEKGCTKLGTKVCDEGLSSLQFQYDAAVDAKGRIHTADLGGEVVVRDSTGYFYDRYELLPGVSTYRTMHPCGDGVCSFRDLASGRRLVSFDSRGNPATDDTISSAQIGGAGPLQFASRGAFGYFVVGEGTTATFTRVTGF